LFLFSQELPSEKDSPETLRAKMGTASGGSRANVPLPKPGNKFGKQEQDESNPFGYAADNQDHYWALQDSADRLLGSFEALGPEGGFLSTQKARDVLVKTGLTKDQLRLIWNLSDMDRDGYFDHDEYVVAMFLCDAVIQKGRPIPTELPSSVIPPSKRPLMIARKNGKAP
jgi:EH domain-containing protein 1